jgi:signal transduction histidine kinase
MNTGSLRRRVVLTTLPVLAVVLAAVTTGVTLLYRASLERELTSRLTAAAGAMRVAWPAGQGKQLALTLALQGIATDIGPEPPGAQPMPIDSRQPGVGVARRGSLLMVWQTLPDGTQITYYASEQRNDRAVHQLLAIEVAVSLAALGLATLLVLRAATTALRPLTDVAQTARRIASGERSRRLRPDRPDTQLGSMAAAFDQMLDALERQIQRAESAETAMRGFLADASHELRTPIAAVQASAETLLREQPERPDRDALEASLARDASRLGRLVDDLLGLARSEAQRRPVLVDVGAFVRTCVDEAAARAPDVRITLDVQDRAASHADTQALRRLLRNLLDNALAAVPHPAGAVHVCIRRAGEDIRVCVTDNGPGIPDAERERVFERFVRLDPTTQGHGLGLAIARRIARLHGGDLTCDPANSGASFTLRLPLAGTMPQDHRANRSATAGDC